MLLRRRPVGSYVERDSLDPAALNARRFELEVEAGQLRVPREKAGNGATHPPRLLGVDHLERVPEFKAALLLHLHDEQPAPAAEDEVELVATDSDVRADEPIAPQAVMPECDSLAPVHAAEGLVERTSSVGFRWSPRGKDAGSAHA